MCMKFDSEFNSLKVIYDKDPTLSRDAWLALVVAADAWTEFVRARGSLHFAIREARSAQLSEAK